MQSPDLRLTDELWLAGNDEAGVGGRRVAGRAFAAGLAGGLLGELVRKKYVVVDGGWLYLERWEPLRDQALDTVVAHLHREEEPLREARREREREAIRRQEEVLRQREAWLREQQPLWQRGQYEQRHAAWNPPSYQEPIAASPEAWVPPAHDLHVWIAYLVAEHQSEDPEDPEPVASLAETLVTRRLSRTGLLELEEVPRLLRRRPKLRYRPRDSADSGLPANRLKLALERRAQLSERDLFLAGLIMATGVHLHAFATLDRFGRRECDQQLKTGFKTQGLRSLLDAVESFVGGSVTSGRL